MQKFTEEDLICWKYVSFHFVRILNGEYGLEEAREDLRGLIGSEFDPRTKSNNP